MEKPLCLPYVLIEAGGYGLLVIHHGSHFSEFEIIGFAYFVRFLMYFNFVSSHHFTPYFSFQFLPNKLKAEMFIAN